MNGPTIIDGKALSNKIKENIRTETENFKKQTGKVPGLTVVIIGNDPASQTYVAMKEKACQYVGFSSSVIRLKADTTETELLECVKKLNEDNDVNGILVQLPLPKNINEDTVINNISVEKDVDGFHPFNVGKLLIGKPTFVSCTPYGIIKLLEEYGISTEGKHAVIIGRSNIVGKPIAALLMQKSKTGNATVTIAHSRTKNIPELTRQADILIAAIGKPDFVTSDMVKDGAVVIDVGINRVDDESAKRGYRLVGDVDFDAVKDKASAITPVPGGVGPMTIAMLLENTLLSFKKANDLI
ncbi:MAG: bifunctional methylenetetrahydrofolate dehydrogenase/methenyltetrahydrofolate cyclohydrolase FolD [Candidatus Aureabacteria bacterium]|nr:bifunctional methylenetetrahydrofolate dehydrogenase/methenyltetrahydrofolate cyclohydrolase FolD [Candidatus Auribacterota bacterium]